MKLEVKAMSGMQRVGKGVNQSERGEEVEVCRDGEVLGL
jgi:hypothetical protein